MFSSYTKTLPVLLILFSCCLWGQNGLDVYFDEPTIEIRQVQPPGHISGILPHPDLVTTLSREFFSAIRVLPKEFIQKSGIRYVTFLQDMKFKGFPAAGMASKVTNTIYLSTTFKEKTIYHELYHIFDPIRENQYWCRLNPHNFIYTGSKYYSENLSRSKSRRANRNVPKYQFDFVSRYAMSNEREDRAETFAYMILEKRHFLNRTRRSKVLKKKMDYIIEITSKEQLISKSFWYNHFRR